jgi:DNA mismatch endonuclease (patch repair protein)
VNKDRLTKARRSWNMSRIRGKDTAPERVVRSLLHRMGYRFRLHVRIPIEVRSAKRGARNSLSGPTGAPTGESGMVGRRTPRAVSVDILLPKHKTAIFVHGCFWHRHPGCENCTTPSNRRKWWIAKLDGNAARDKLHQRALQRLGWRPIVVWECETEKPERLARLAQRLASVADLGLRPPLQFPASGRSGQ